MTVKGENQSAWRNTSSSVTLPTTNPRWTSLGLNLGLCAERPATTCLSQLSCFCQPIMQHSTHPYSNFNFTFMHWGPQQRDGGMFECEERLLKSHHTQVQKNYIKYEKKFSNFPVQVVL